MQTWKGEWIQWLSTTLSAKWFGRLVPDDTKWLVKSDWLACCCNHCSLQHVALPQNKLLRERFLLSNSVNCQTYLLILKKKKKKAHIFNNSAEKNPCSALTVNSTIQLPVLFFVYNSKTRESQWNLWDYKGADRSVVTQSRQSLWLQGDKTQVQTCQQPDYARVHSLVPFIILQPPTTQMASQNKCASTASLSQHPVQAGWVLSQLNVLIWRRDPCRSHPTRKGHRLQDGWNQSTAWESTAASVTHPGTCWVKWSDSWCWHSWNHTKMGHGVIKRGRS